MHFSATGRGRAVVKPTIESLLHDDDSNSDDDGDDTGSTANTSANGGLAGGRSKDLVQRLMVNYARQLGGTAATLDRGYWASSPSGNERTAAAVGLQLNDADDSSDDASGDEDDARKGGSAVTEGDVEFNFRGISEQLSDRFQQFTSSPISTGDDDDQLACLICLEVIGKTQATWSCRGCYEVYHLVCVQKWSSQAVQVAELRDEEAIWRCPKCRLDYTGRERPTRYFCFCGQTQDPPVDAWLLAHSCGEACRRPLTGCTHTCLLLCHPGPCPACPKVVSTRCFCGRQAAKARRCGQAGWACGGRCSKTLDCGRHQCADVCHPGSCEPCAATSKRECRCGKASAVKPCSDGEWSCERTCGRTLTCHEHTCTSVCHAGACPPCVRPGQNSCPCGKQTYGADLQCVDQLPCCGDTCGKKLDCGMHECFEACHRGECPPCTLERKKQCRCGARQKLMACNMPFQCDSKCKRKRQCGRHACSRRCCDGSCPPCEQQCGRTLNCGNHKCVAPCHEGPCYPCPEIAEIACFCGATKTRVPCGRRRHTRVPRCAQRCVLPSVCHHTTTPAHACHDPADKRCPPCRLVCAKVVCARQHTCAARCHSAVWTDVNREQMAKAATPWEKPTSKFELVNQDCPPCQHPVPVTCKGHHETTEFPCCEVRAFSCGRKCDRVLKCGNHKCSQECHEVIGEGDENAVDCDECSGLCDRKRPEGCRHRCLERCHPGECAPCRQMVKEMCHCGINPCYVPCGEWTSLSASARSARLQCGNECPRLTSDCGHKCVLACHTGPCSSKAQCRTRVPVRCPCGRRSERRVCAKVNKDTKLDCDAECEQSAQLKTQSSESYESRSSVEKEDDNSVADSVQLPGAKRSRKKKERHRGDDTKAASFVRRHVATMLAAAALLAVLAWLLANNV